MNDQTSTDFELDTCGLYCPEPVMMLHQQIRKMAVGETVKVTATDPSTSRDIPKFCRFLEHELVQEHESEGLYIYVIRKAAGDQAPR